MPPSLDQPPDNLPVAPFPGAEVDSDEPIDDLHLVLPLPEEAVDQFLVLYRQEYRVDLDRGEARAAAERLLRFYFAVLSTPRGAEPWGTRCPRLRGASPG